MECASVGCLNELTFANAGPIAGRLILQPEAAPSRARILANSLASARLNRLDNWRLVLMSRQARYPSSELSPNHFSYEALQRADWKQFERATVDILERYYKPFGLSITRTIKSSGGDIGSDGSRDCEGTVVFGGDKRDLVSSRVLPWFKQIWAC